MSKYDVDFEQANILNSLVYIISAVASPFIGLLIDKTGLNLIWCESPLIVSPLHLRLISTPPSFPLPLQ